MPVTTFRFHLLQVLVLLLVTNVTSQDDNCGIGNIQYGVVRTGRTLRGHPEWAVTISHTCKTCKIGEIIFGNCDNWNTVEPVDPNLLFLKSGRFCAVKRGAFLKPGKTVQFSYAWDLPVVWFPSSADIQCPGLHAYSVIKH